MPQESPEHASDDVLSLTSIMGTEAVETYLDTCIDDGDVEEAVRDWISELAREKALHSEVVMRDPFVIVAAVDEIQ